MRLPYLIRTLINFNTGFNRLCEFLNSPEQHRELDDPTLPAGPSTWKASVPRTSKTGALREPTSPSHRGASGDHQPPGRARAACCIWLPALTASLPAASAATAGLPIWAINPG